MKVTQPTLPASDKRFRYVPSHSTDIRKTFARIKRQQQQTPQPEKESL